MRNGLESGRDRSEWRESGFTTVNPDSSLGLNLDQSESEEPTRRSMTSSVERWGDIPHFGAARHVKQITQNLNHDCWEVSQIMRRFKILKKDWKTMSRLKFFWKRQNVLLWYSVHCLEEEIIKFLFIINSAIYFWRYDISQWRIMPQLF